MYATSRRAKARRCSFRNFRNWWSGLARTRDEARLALREKVPTGKREEPQQEGASSFIPLSSSHETGGAISDFGDHFSAAEINAAEKLKREPQLSGVPVTTIAFLLKKVGAEIDPTEPAGEPLQIEKKKLREEINVLARRLAIGRNHEQPDFKRVWIDLHRLIGARNLDDLMDNHSIDRMRQARELVKSWLGGKDAAA